MDLEKMIMDAYEIAYQEAEKEAPASEEEHQDIAFSILSEII